MEFDKLFGGATATQVLLFLARYEEGGASEIAKAFEVSKTQVFIQLSKLEKAGIITSRQIANVKLYSFNPRSGIKVELVNLLQKYIGEQMSHSENKSFFLVRRRPRSKGKPLRGVYED